MDPTLSKHLQELIHPLLVRIENLERNNEELRERVRLLENQLPHEHNYQKNTISSCKHLRESRISSKDSDSGKRPSWNSKTKIDQSPLKNSDPVTHEKIKTKPPIPKIVKSPQKPTQEEMRPPLAQKRIHGGTRVPTADNNQQKNVQSPSLNSPQQQTPSPSRQEKSSQKESDKEKFNNKFLQLVKHNNEIINSMKTSNEPTKQPSALGNLVSKAISPKSEYHQSFNTSPNSRSFISEYPDKQKNSNDESKKMSSEGTPAAVKG